MLQVLNVVQWWPGLIVFRYNFLSLPDGKEQSCMEIQLLIWNLPLYFCLWNNTGNPYFTIVLLSIWRCYFCCFSPHPVSTKAIPRQIGWWFTNFPCGFPPPFLFSSFPVFYILFFKKLQLCKRRWISSYILWPACKGSRWAGSNIHMLTHMESALHFFYPLLPRISSVRCNLWKCFSGIS